ncbi:MAG: choice-of-anchor B family protein [Nitriliruptorales bacterium]|nr:choice-of-anchor B family protein [Nitriliruptorales bacterium]
MSAGLVLALALSLLVATPKPAAAHDLCLPSEASGGVAGFVLQAANVFDSFLPVELAGCERKFDNVEVQIERDFAVEVDGVAPTANEGGSAPNTFAPCVRGMAADTFPCDGVDMLSHVSHAELGTTFVNDIWGWTDPQTRKDYALVGASEGTVFVDITDPKRPQVLGIMPTASTVGGAFWRDIKVYEDHAFVVSEHSNHGVQVFDLTQLRDWDGTYTTFPATARYTGHGSAHNININEDTGFLYSVGANQTAPGIDCGTGLHMIDINEPTNPTFAGCFQDHGYVHDTQCVVYEGPAAAYQGRELCFNSNATSTAPSGLQRVAVVDVTDKSNPVALAREAYDGFGYSHQGWLTPDQQFFLHGDELDEVRRGVNTTTRVWDVRDPENPTLLQVFVNDTTSIDHNIYTQGNYAYASNYTTGLRVHDIRDLEGAGLREAAFFDVYPENDNATFEGGTWSNYPYFRQKGVVAVSSIDRGLFILQPRVSRSGN